MDIVNKLQSLTNEMKLTVILVGIFGVILLYCLYNKQDLIAVQEEKEANILSENFNSNNVNTFTMYYADWCPHCVAAKPEFNKILKYNNKTFKSNTIKIKMVDCVKNPELAEKAGVTGFPTFIYNNGTEDEKYTGERNEMGFLGFLKEKVGNLIG